MNKELSIEAFKYAKVADKISLYGNLIDEYNALSSKLKGEKNLKDEITRVKSTMDKVITSTNAILKRIGLVDRLDSYDTISLVLAQVLWKLHVHKERSVSKL